MISTEYSGFEEEDARAQLQRDIQILEARKDTVRQALQTDEEKLNVKLQTTLRKLKDQKPEFFYITFEEQIGKLTVELSISLLHWLIILLTRALLQSPD